MTLTPYDKGTRLEPKPWVDEERFPNDSDQADYFGKVDFDNDEGNTMLTVHCEPDDHGNVVVYIDTYFLGRAVVKMNAPRATTPSAPTTTTTRTDNQ